jgi:hypothetical protein
MITRRQIIELEQKRFKIWLFFLHLESASSIASAFLVFTIESFESIKSSFFSKDDDDDDAFRSLYTLTSIQQQSWLRAASSAESKHRNSFTKPCSCQVKTGY